MRRSDPSVKFSAFEFIEPILPDVDVERFGHRFGIHDIEAVGLSDGRDEFFSTRFEYPVAREAVSFGRFEGSSSNHFSISEIETVYGGASEIPERVAEDVEIMA